MRPQRIDESDQEYKDQAATSYLVVLPVITSTYADRCVASILDEDGSSGFDPGRVLIVDNSRDGFAEMRYGGGHAGDDDGRSPPAFWNDRARDLRFYRDPDGHNLGTSRAWNIGAREVLGRGLDYLVICSASMLFGPIYNTTFTRQLAWWRVGPEPDRDPRGEGYANVVEALGHSFHLIAFHRRVFETVGVFCPAFYPGYFEAVDFSRRMSMVGMEGGSRWQKVWVNAMSQAVGGHLDVIACPAGPLLKVYRDRWGGDKGEERYTLPEGDKPLDYFVEEPIPVLAERYGLGEYGEGWW